ncbi:MAG: type II toxin-antitoxin system HigB family toxin [Candidatus Sulfotelmatobacter sp.]
MHVISRKKLKEAAARHGELEGPLDVWFRIAKKAAWKSLADLRKTFSTAEAVVKWTVFNVKGNRYRLIAEVNYAYGRIYVRHVLTHTEYDGEVGSNERKRSQVRIRFFIDQDFAFGDRE